MPEAPDEDIYDKAGIPSWLQSALEIIGYFPTILPEGEGIVEEPIVSGRPSGRPGGRSGGIVEEEVEIGGVREENIDEIQQGRLDEAFESMFEEPSLGATLKTLDEEAQIINEVNDRFATAARQQDIMGRDIIIKSQLERQLQSGEITADQYVNRVDNIINRNDIFIRDFNEAQERVANLRDLNNDELAERTQIQRDLDSGLINRQEYIRRLNQLSDHNLGLEEPNVFEPSHEAVEPLVEEVPPRIPEIMNEPEPIPSTIPVNPRPGSTISYKPSLTPPRERDLERNSQLTEQDYGFTDPYKPTLTPPRNDVDDLPIIPLHPTRPVNPSKDKITPEFLDRGSYPQYSYPGCRLVCRRI